MQSKDVFVKVTSAKYSALDIFGVGWSLVEFGS